MAEQTDLPAVLREYGQAFRGDWSSGAIDGRSVRKVMADIASWVEDPAKYPGDEAARERLGICPSGEGHWSGLYCDDDCTPAPTDERPHTDG
jgi:hypothetical protein